MYKSHVPQCTIQNRKVLISFLNCAMWDTEQVLYVICETGLYKVLPLRVSRLSHVNITQRYVCGSNHDDVIKWKHFPHYWPFVLGIHQSPVFPFICDWINHGWANNREAGDLRRHWAFYDVTSMTLELVANIYTLYSRGPISQTYLSIYLVVYSLQHNVLPTLQSIPLMTNEPLYPITQDSSCHGQHTMPRNPWSFPMTSSA